MIQEIVITDSIPFRGRSAKFTVLSVAELLAKLSFMCMRTYRSVCCLKRCNDLSAHFGKGQVYGSAIYFCLGGAALLGVAF